MKRPAEKGNKYKTARISYITNYIIVALLIFLWTFLPLFKLSLPLPVDIDIFQLASLAILFFILLLGIHPDRILKLADSSILILK